ncbi:MAG: hypothetical protein HOI23_19505 [Deltaproteobacteria bacterium]|jgi:TolB-like protein|nr:hypothetical protein [Deltaproteobacteria bacterium]MBT6435510.1 hypothetical protein [Deltaproteobacteria bacterium]
MNQKIYKVCMSILLVSLIASEGWASAKTDIQEALDSIATSLKEQAKPEAIQLSPVLCKDGQDLSPLLVTGLSDQGFQVVTETKRQQELTENIETAKSSMAYPWLLSGSCVTTSTGNTLSLRVTDAQSGRVLASYATPEQTTSSLEAKSLLTQLRKLSDQVIKNLNSMDGNLRYQRFAIANFEEIGQSSQDKQLGLVVSAQLQSMLQNDHNLFLVEREEVAKLVDEIQLGQMGLVSETDAVEIGKMSGAQALILGSVAEAGSQYLVQVRIVSVGEAKVWASAETSLPAADLITLSSDAAVLRSRSGAIYRSMLLPGWGQFYNREPLKGSVFVGGEVITAGLGAMFHIFGSQAQADYDALGVDANPEEFSDLRDQATGHYKMRNIMIYTAIGIHVLGILDAAFNGYDGSSGNGNSSNSPLSWSF